MAQALRALQGELQPGGANQRRRARRTPPWRARWTPPSAARLSDMGDHEPPNVAQAPPCTTHFSVVDRDGNLCAVTQTLLSIFGSRVVSPATGVLLNNGIMWFDPEPGKPNSLGPGKRCLDQLLPRGGGGRGRPALRPGRLGRAQDPGRG
jgi:gamma-glutamyltranspeptidase